MKLSALLKGLKAHGVPVAPFAVTFTDALALKRPIVVKADSIEHKAAKGLVFLNLASKEEIENAVEAIKAAGVEAIFQEMKSGVELIIGFREDQNFGKIGVFGLGGRLIEVEKDIYFFKVPAGKEEVVKAIERTKIGKNLEKFGISRKVLVDIILKLQEVYLQKGFKELEVNPLIASAEGMWVVDVRAVE